MARPSLSKASYGSATGILASTKAESNRAAPQPHTQQTLGDAFESSRSVRPTRRAVWFSERGCSPGACTEAEPSRKTNFSLSCHCSRMHMECGAEGSDGMYGSQDLPTKYSCVMDDTLPGIGIESGSESVTSTAEPGSRVPMSWKSPTKMPKDVCRRPRMARDPCPMTKGGVCMESIDSWRTGMGTWVGP